MTGVLRIRHLAVLVACCAGIAMLVTACGGSSSSAKVPKGAVAVVGAQAISQSQFDSLLQEYFSGTFTANKQPIPKAGSDGYKTGVQKVMQYLVQKAELEEQAKKLGITVTPKDIDDGIKKDITQYFGGSRAKLLAAMKKQGITMAQFRDTVAFSALQNKLVAKLTANDKVTDSEALAYYNKNKKQYETPKSRAIEHILVKTKAEAQKLYDQLQKGASFAALAKKYSIDTSSGAQGGKLGVQPESGLVPAFAKVAFALPTGVLSKPVHSQYGWHLIKATGPVIPASTSPFAKVKASIVSELKQAKNSQTMSKFQDTLTAYYKTRIEYANGYAPPATTATPPASTSVIPGG
jgi:parvulin-like peptidyl-prolyl isomerase